MSGIGALRRFTPLALAVALLTACTGASAGQPSAGAAEQAGQRAQDFAISNGKLVGAVIIAIAGVTFVRWLWGNVAMRIVLALIIGGAVVYFATRGGR